MPFTSAGTSRLRSSRMRRVLSAILPAVLAALVLVLAVLQYRWLGQVSEIERQEMRASLLRRAEDFGAEFNREIQGLHAAFASVESENTGELPARVAGAYKQWHAAARFAGIIKAVYVASRSNSETIAAIDLDTGTSSAMPVPDALRPAVESLRRTQWSGGMRLNDAEGRRITRVETVAGMPFISQIPAIVIWLPTRVPLAPPPGRSDTSPRFDLLLQPNTGEHAVIVVLDREYMRRAVLPALLDRHFGAVESGRQLPPVLVSRSDVSAPARIQVVDAAGSPLISRGLPEGETLAADAADVIVPFMPGPEGLMMPDVRVAGIAGDVREMRVESDITVRRERRGIPPIATSAGLTTFTLPIQSWQVRVQHGAGSLDAAVAVGRRRNLTLSFGILAVLVAAMALVFANARRAERLAAQQMQFVATVSHELRTPLAVIRSAAENISAGIVTSPDQAVRYGRLIETEGRRLTGMVEQVLTHAGISSTARRAARTRPVDVEAVANEAVTATAALAEQAGCTLEMDVEPGMPPAIGDDVALRSAIENLLTNAIKHAADGRHIRLTARRVTDRALTDSGASVPVIRVSVSDRGPGIEALDLPHIFEPFYRGQRSIDAQIQGSGLGLSLVKRSIEDIGGRVEYEPTRGGGSTFSILLPAAAHDSDTDVA